MKKRKMEFSKKILIFCTGATVIIVGLAFLLMWRTGDLSPLSFIITGIFAELASATGFYYWKAKNENMVKINQNTIQIKDLNEEVTE